MGGITSVQARLGDNNQVHLTWSHHTARTHEYKIAVIKDGGYPKIVTASGKDGHYILCDPAAKYDFSVSYEDNKPVRTGTIYTAPSRIVHLNFKENETSVLVYWDPLRNEKVRYSVAVVCKDETIARVKGLLDCSYELDFNNLSCQSESFEFNVWAVSESGRRAGNAAVRKLNIGTKVKDTKAVIENGKAIVTWKYLLNKKFMVQVIEDGEELGKHTVSEKKFRWLCRPSHKYDFRIKIENVADSSSVSSNSVYADPSRISHLDIERNEKSLRISWPVHEDECVSYNFVVLHNSKIIRQDQKMKNCFFILNLDDKIRQADSCVVKVWAVSNQGDKMSEPVVRELNTGVFDLNARYENGQVLVTWDSLLRNQFKYRVVKNGREIEHVHVTSRKKIEWPCEPACKYEFVVQNMGKNGIEIISDSVYTDPLKPGNLIVEETSDGLLAQWRKSDKQDVGFVVKVYRDNSDKTTDEKIIVDGQDGCSYRINRELLYLSSQYKIEVFSIFLERIWSAEPAIGVVNIVGKLRVHYVISMTGNKVLITYFVKHSDEHVDYDGKERSLVLTPRKEYSCVLKGKLQIAPAKRFLHHEDLWRGKIIQHEFIVASEEVDCCVFDLEIFADRKFIQTDFVEWKHNSQRPNLANSEKRLLNNTKYFATKVHMNYALLNCGPNIIVVAVLEKDKKMMTEAINFITSKGYRKFAGPQLTKIDQRTTVEISLYVGYFQVDPPVGYKVDPVIIRDEECFNRTFTLSNNGLMHSPTTSVRCDIKQGGKNIDCITESLTPESLTPAARPIPQKVIASQVIFGGNIHKAAVRGNYLSS